MQIKVSKRFEEVLKINRKHFLFIRIHILGLEPILRSIKTIYGKLYSYQTTLSVLYFNKENHLSCL